MKQPGKCDLVGIHDVPRPFHLMRWFSIVILLALLPVACVTGFILSYFMREEILQRDATLTAQFVQNCIEVEGRHAGLGDQVGFSEFLDDRGQPAARGPSQDALAFGRLEFQDHLQFLPDVLLATLFAPDGRIIWSSNPALIGRVAAGSHDLERAFSGIQVVRVRDGSDGGPDRAAFLVQPRESFTESYIPLRDGKGNVALVAGIHKEPASLLATIRKGQRLMWATTVAAGIIIFLAMFKIIRTGSTMLQRQQKQLAEMESLAFLGEVSSAVAHGLRNPLAGIRSSAELVLCADYGPVAKNARDIIAQVDFLSRWVKELLLVTQPMTGEPEPVELTGLIRQAVEAFAPHCARVGIRVVRMPAEMPPAAIEGNTSLVTQVLHSVLANAVEAMPRGGELRIALEARPETGRAVLTIGDTGVGMSERELALAFRPFHTTKRQGLGVGLAIVKRVMERFGGSVALSSRENEGTTVRLEFRMT